MIGDTEWIMEEWKFSLGYIDRYNLNKMDDENFGVLLLCLSVVDELENCGGYIP